MESFIPSALPAAGALLLGVGAGIAHVLAGPDHLVTVSSLVLHDRRRAWLVGFLWGTGHTSGFWLVGVLALLWHDGMDWPRMGAWGECLGGLALIGLGLWGMWRDLGTRPLPGKGGKLHLACVLGSLHGLTGSSHYLGALPALVFPSHVSGALYLSGFGLGSMGAMVCFAWSWGRSCAWLGARGSAWAGALQWLSSLCALCAGAYWVGRA